MNRASDTSLRVLHDAAEVVYKQISDGADPKQAVKSAATAAKYSKAWTSRLCEITNRLIACDHIDIADGEKAAGEHPVVETDQVLEELFPTTVVTLSDVKAAAASIPHSWNARPYRYSDIPAPMVKQASEKQADARPRLGGFPDEQAALDRADVVRRRFDDAVGMVREKRAEAEYELAPLCKLAVTAIKESGLNPAEIEERAVAWFGKDAHAVMSAIGGFAGGFKRFKGEPRIFTTDPWDRAPFSNVKAAVIAFRQNALELDIRQTVEDIAKRASSQIRQGIHKAANVIGTASLAALAKSKLNEASSPKESDEDDIHTAGLTPEHVAYLNTIRAKQALVPALNDPVISRMDLNDVVRAYNRIANVVPRSFMNGTTLITMLRQALEQPDLGATDIALMQNVEKGLAQQQDVSNP